MNHLPFAILLFLLANVTTTFGQRPPSIGGGSGGGFGSFGNTGRGGGGGNVGEVTLDTSDIFYFFADNPNLIFPFEDSLLGHFQQYDPARQQMYDYGHLGNLGSAARPLFYQPSFRQGFDVGLHQFDMYQIKTSDVRFYKIEQAYTQAGHSQGQTQSDAFTNVRFSRNFANGINFSLEYRKIDNAGAYDNQKAKNSDVAAGLWFHNKYDTYDGFFTLVNNSVEQQDNGGIAEGADTVYEDAFRLDVNLLNSNTRHANREYAYTQYFYLNKILSQDNIDRRTAARKARKEEKEKKKAERRLAKLAARDSTLRDTLTKDSTLVLPDSLQSISPKDSLSQKPPVPKNVDKAPAPPGGKRPGAPPTGRPPASRPPVPGPPPGIFGTQPAALDVPEGRIFTIYHQTAWRTDSYKFSALPSDSLYFGNFWVDNRGLRHFLEIKKLQNTVKLQTFKLRKAAPDPTGRALPAEGDLLEVGIVHALYLIDQEPLERDRLNNLFLTGSLNFSPNDRIRIRTYGHLGVGANAGDFRLSGDLFLNFRKIGNLRLEAVNQLSTPSLLHQRFFVSEQQIWKNDFGKTLETSLKGTYTLPAFNLSIAGAYNLVNNLVYFGTDGLARQDGSVISVVQLSVQKDFHTRLVHFENWLGVQQSTSSNLRLPAFYSKHSLYLEGKIFKKAMLTQFGFDARLNTGYSPYNYHPLIGQFFLQNDQEIPFTPLIDVFLNFKVKTFRFFFKLENLLPYVTEQYYFQTASYPMPYGFSSGGLRMGVNWRLVD